MNQQELNEVLEAYPNLYHMAERGAWEGIREYGLLSASALLDLYGVQGEKRFALESQRREAISSLQSPRLPRLPVAKLRDQRAMDDDSLSECLQGGMTPQQWYECLNRKVFFWLKKERLDEFCGAYKDGEREVLVLNTREFVTAHRDEIWLCAMNSGASKPWKHCRGPGTFSRIDDYPYCRKRSWKRRVVELCVDSGVADVTRFVERVYVVEDAKEVAELPL